MHLDIIHELFLHCNIGLNSIIQIRFLTQYRQKKQQPKSRKIKVKDFELNTLFEPITDRRVSSHALRQSSS